ncbi:hypothetical protein MMC13_007250 [Lambiella insularis]|nr:hypothetical protein [Lambiella insularis]
MSGHGDSRRSDRDRDRDRYRERSPSRDTSRDSRSRDDSHVRGRPQGGYDHDHRGGDYGRRRGHDDSRSSGRSDSGNDRGRGRYGGGDSRGSTRGYRGDNQGPGRGLHTQFSTPSTEKLPDLPKDVPTPATGAQVNLKTRDGEGTVGHPIIVEVNHFTIKTLPTVKVYQYEIRMAVPVSSQRRGSEKVSVMQQAKVVLKARKFWGDSFTFDNNTLGWSTTLLMPVGESRTAFIELDDQPNPEKPNQVEVTLRNSGTLNVKKFVGHLLNSGTSGTISNDRDIENIFKALNAAYRQDPASRFTTRPNSSAFFSRSPALVLTLQSTGGILEALRGAFQAVSYCFGQLTLNADVVCSAFYVPGLALTDVAKAMAGIPPYQKLNEIGSTPMFRQGCERLTGMFFVVKHLNSVRNAKKIKIQRLSIAGSRETTFEEKNISSGTTAITSVYEYFRRKYNITLRYPDLPLLVSTSGMFPMELCYTPHSERYKEALQGTETADFIKFATTPAYIRAEHIMQNVKRFAWHTLPIPASLGLSVSTSMLQIRGRLLPAPQVLYGRGSDDRGPEGGSWNLRGKSFLKPARFTSWGVMYLPGGLQQLSDYDLQQFCRSLVTSMATVGLGTPNSPPAFLKGNALGNLKGAVGDLVRKTANAFRREKPEMLFFLLHDKANPSIYKAIKSICEVDLGIPSQIMLVEKALNSRGQMQYLGNIGLKVNCKLGGVNSKVDEPLFRQTRYMMLGADCSHPSAASLRQIPPPPTYCALVGSYDSSCTAYTAIASAQPATQEMIAAFGPMVNEILTRYKSRNSVLPQSIIYWRDGVSDPEIPAFLKSEVQDLRAALDQHNLPIKLTVVNCVKRHQTRMFPKSERGDKNGNVLPGSVIDSAKNDFFLVSQSALQGTVRPCHYKKLFDENNLSVDDLHRLAMNGTFSYGRATRSVSIHPAVYYADQVAERAKFHIRETEDGIVLKDVHDDLKFTMYWQ